MLLVQLKPADVACRKATLRTSPSSGQATDTFKLRRPKLPACHSRAAFEGSADQSLWYDFGDHCNHDYIRSGYTARQLQSLNAVECDTKMPLPAHSTDFL